MSGHKGPQGALEDLLEGLRRPLKSPEVLVIPKASFFRSMAGGVPSGATEGSSMGPPFHPPNFTFSGSFFGTLFAPKTLFSVMKNQDFEVHFGGPKRGGLGTLFVKIAVFFGIIFGNPVCSENLIFCNEKPTL